MQKLSLTLILVLSIFTVACGEKKTETPTEEAETILEFKRFQQLNDTNPDTAAGERLHCSLFCAKSVDGALKYDTADVKTSGQCDWAALKGQLNMEEAKAYPAENTAAILPILEGVEGIGSFTEDRKWDCATVQIKTNKRELQFNDCNIRDRSVADTNGWKKGLTKEPAGSIEEAAFRINQLTIIE